MTAEELTDDELLALVRERGLVPGPTRWTVRAFADDWLRLFPSDDTRRTYRTHIKRLCEGVGPVCDSTACEPCMVAPGFLCRCTCRACTTSRLWVEEQGDRPLGTDALSARNASALTRIARRMAVKKGVVENRARAARGRPPKPAPGIGAEETCVHALRSLFSAAGKVLRTEVAGAAEVEMPGRPTGRRRALHDFELVELYEVTVGGGGDPELDELLFDFGLTTGARREGTYRATVGALHLEGQIVTVKDKYEKPWPMPVSAELVERLLAHAIERGGEACDPKSPCFRPDAALFYYRPTKDGSPHPLTDKHFDALHARWHRERPWAAELGTTYHWLRHTMSDQLKRDYGQHYAKRFLRHTDKSVTDRYGQCTTEQLAGALGQIFGFENPLATSHLERRSAVLGRYGIEVGGLPGANPLVRRIFGVLEESACPVGRATDDAIGRRKRPATEHTKGSGNK